MLRKKWFIVLLVLFCAWFITSAYYYIQHRITVKNCTLNREVAVENMVIHLDEISFTDLERNQMPLFNSKCYKTIAKLPAFVQQPCVKTTSFYRKPYRELKYNYNGQYGIIKIRGTMTTDKLIDAPIYDKIALVSETGVHFSGQKTAESDSGSSSHRFSVSGNYFNISDKTVSFVIKNEAGTTLKSIPITLNWDSETTYNYFNPPPSSPVAGIW